MKRWSKALKFSNEIKRGRVQRYARTFEWTFEWRSGNEADKCNSRSRANDSSRNEKYRTSPFLHFRANEIPFTTGDKDRQRYGLILGGSHRASVDALAVKGLNRFREWRRNVVSRSSVYIYIYYVRATSTLLDTGKAGGIFMSPLAAMRIRTTVSRSIFDILRWALWPWKNYPLLSPLFLSSPFFRRSIMDPFRSNRNVISLHFYDIPFVSIYIYIWYRFSTFSLYPPSSHYRGTFSNRKSNTANHHGTRRRVRFSSPIGQSLHREKTWISVDMMNE